MGQLQLRAERSQPGAAADLRAVLALATLVAAVHLLVNFLTSYGIHRDELLYLAMGRHLQLFRMDFPPFIAILAQLSRLLGDSLVAIRLGPALAHGAIVLLAGLLAARFGAGRFGQLLATATVAVGPLFLRPGALFQPVVFDQLWWTAALLVLAGIPAEVTPHAGARQWLLLGAILGIGLLTKFSIAFIGVGIVAAVLLTDLRRWLLTPWPWLAALLALALGSPSLAGQVALGFPVVGQMQDLAATQLERIGPAAFLLGQVEMLQLTVLLAAVGAVRLLRGSDERARTVGWSCLVAFAMLLLLRGKPYYAGPIYPALLAAGAAAIESWTAGFQRRGARLAVRGVAYGSCVVLPLLLLPLGLPILPPAQMARYGARLGFTAATTTNRGEILELPQDYADMLGWEAQVAAVARAYRALTPAERERAVLIADNYGEAGAIDFFGPRYGLPAAITPTGSYWFFGPGSLPGDVVIKVGADRDDLLQYYRTVELSAIVNERWVVPEERDLHIWVCRRPIRTLQEIWPMFEGQN